MNPLSSWRDKILEDFQDPLPSITLATDPDGLLLDEKLSAKFTEKNIGVYEYQDPVAFRYLYEMKFRSGLEDNFTNLLVRVADNSLEQLPFDLLKLGHKLDYSLAGLFPKMSTPIIRHLGSEELDVLYNVYDQYQGSNSDTKTCDFILRRVYKVAYDTISTQADLFKYLLSKHYQLKQYPEIIENYLIEQLKCQRSLIELPLEDLIKSKTFFYSYLQEQWSGFLEGQQQLPEKVQERALYSPLTHPFLDPDVRRLLDNLFIEGKLKPVAGYDPKRLPEWTKVGIVVDPIKDEKIRIKNLINLLDVQVSEVKKYQDWMKIITVYSEMKASILSLQLEKEGKDDSLIKQVSELETRINDVFSEWIIRYFGSLRNLPYLPKPVMVHHIPHYLASQQHKKIALVVLDGMSYIQWIQIRKIMETEQNKFVFKEHPVYAWVPTVTSVSRQTIFSGEIPMYFANSIDKTTKEPTAWKLFWENQDIPKMYSAYEKSLGKGDYKPIESLLKPNKKIVGLVINAIDDFVHGSIQGQQGVYAELTVWMKNGYLVKLLEDLISHDFEVYLTSDHGNKQSVGIGRLSQGVLAETRGERVRIYKDFELWEETASKYSSIKWPGEGLPNDLFVLLSQHDEAFVKEGDVVIGHGGISLEEVIVPFVRVKINNNNGEV